MPYVLYIASALGAAALLLMMPRPAGYTPWKLGALLGAATLGGLWLYLHRTLGVSGDGGLAQGAFAYQYVFSAIAIAAAARVVTHTRPVYSALWFVMVVLATAGLFLVLSAQFMAFAMVIIYGGAILVTYIFVIMLASQAGDTAVVHSTAAADRVAAPDDAPRYDRAAREPVAAVAVGFLLLAALLAIVFRPLATTPRAAAPPDAVLAEQFLAERSTARLAAQVKPEHAAAVGATNDLSNVERVGLDLFRSHPLGIELAGVILLVSLVGAVVIARMKVEGNPGLADKARLGGAADAGGVGVGEGGAR